MFLEHFAGCMLGWFAWISCQKLDSLLLFVIFITLILLTWLGIISETYFSKKQAHLCGKVNDQCWVEMKRLLGKNVMKGHIPWTYKEFTKFEDISSTRMEISLSKSRFNIKHSKDSLHFSILIAHLSSPVCRASRQGRYIENWRPKFEF